MFITLKFIKSDFYRKFGNSNNLFFLIKSIVYFFYSSTMRFLIYFRLASSDFFLFKFVGTILYYLSPSRKRIQIPIGTKIGYGFYIAHEGYIMINKKAIIGNNCNIAQFCPIGATTSRNAPVIGNQVYIGPNSCIIENVKVGSNVVIGAGSIVVKNVPDNCTVAGNYAKIISEKNSEKFIKNIYEGEKNDR